MQFLLIARDHDTDDAKAARSKARSEHMQILNVLKALNLVHDAGAILSESGRMIGSMIIANFESREAVEDYLRSEPFHRDNVWNEIEILPFRTVQWTPPPLEEIVS